jgi:hypothetical protein
VALRALTLTAWAERDAAQAEKARLLEGARSARRADVIGQGGSQRLDVTPAQYQMAVSRRLKYACRNSKQPVNGTVGRVGLSEVKSRNVRIGA